jgi:hypothetical protein
MKRDFMEHNIAEDCEQPSRASTAVSVTADELERRRALADEVDRIRAAVGPLRFSAVAIIREFRDGQTGYLS